MGERYKDLSAVPSRITGIGDLPQAYAAFDPSKGSTFSMTWLNLLSTVRGKARLLNQLDELKRFADKGGVESAGEFEQQAFDVISAVCRRCLIFPMKTRWVERYDTGHIKIRKGLPKKKKNGKAIPGFSPEALGKQMMMVVVCANPAAPVTVTNTGWDMHGTARMTVCPFRPAVDKAVSAFIEDCEHRDSAKRFCS